MEISAELFKKTKTAIRLTSNDADYEDELKDLISAALTEMQRVGIKKIDQNDPLIISACKAYAKANFGYDNPDAERFLEIFQTIISSLALTAEYTDVPEGL